MCKVVISTTVMSCKVCVMRVVMMLVFKLVEGNKVKLEYVKRMTKLVRL